MMIGALEIETEFKRAILAEYKSVATQLWVARRVLYSHDKKFWALRRLMEAYGLQIPEAAA